METARYTSPPSKIHRLHNAQTARENLPVSEANLTAEQRAEGQRLATEWQAAFEKKR